MFKMNKMTAARMFESGDQFGVRLPGGESQSDGGNRDDMMYPTEEQE
jgi:hypothetical protein